MGIFDSISTTKTHNCALKVNLYYRVAFRESFMIPLPTFHKPMIKIQMQKLMVWSTLAFATFWWAYWSSIYYLYQGFAWYIGHGITITYTYICNGIVFAVKYILNSQERILFELQQKMAALQNSVLLAVDAHCSKKTLCTWLFHHCST